MKTGFLSLVVRIWKFFLREWGVGPWDESLTTEINRRELKKEETEKLKKKEDVVK